MDKPTYDELIEELGILVCSLEDILSTAKVGQLDEHPAHYKEILDNAESMLPYVEELVRRSLPPQTPPPSQRKMHLRLIK